MVVIMVGIALITSIPGIIHLIIKPEWYIILNLKTDFNHEEYFFFIDGNVINIL